MQPFCAAAGTAQPTTQGSKIPVIKAIGADVVLLAEALIVTQSEERTKRAFESMLLKRFRQQLSRTASRAPVFKHFGSFRLRNPIGYETGKSGSYGHFSEKRHPIHWYGKLWVPRPKTIWLNPKRGWGDVNLPCSSPQRVRY